MHKNDSKLTLVKEELLTLTAVETSVYRTRLGVLRIYRRLVVVLGRICFRLNVGNLRKEVYKDRRTIELPI